MNVFHIINEYIDLNKRNMVLEVDNKLKLKLI